MKEYPYSLLSSGELFSSANSIVEAASASLLAVIERLGTSLHRQGYANETASLHALFTEYNTPALAACLETLGATSRYQKLVEAQANFENVDQQKVETGAAVDLPLARKAKIQIATFIIPLLSYVDTNAKLDIEDTNAKLSVKLNVENYAPVVAKIDEIITAVVTIAHARQTRLANEKAEEAKAKE